MSHLSEEVQTYLLRQMQIFKQTPQHLFIIDLKQILRSAMK